MYRIYMIGIALLSNSILFGQVMVSDINGVGGSAYPNQFITVNGITYFVAENAALGRELWKTDGTGSGTVLLKDIRTGGASADPQHLYDLNGTLYFTAIGDTSGRELWKSDGTDAGTVMVKDITSGAGSTGFAQFTDLNGELFFFGSTSGYGQELWKSNGTDTGTVLVKDAYAGVAGGAVDYLTRAGDLLFFRGKDAVQNEEVWVSNGTDTGTVMLKDIRQGSFSARPERFTVLNDSLLFFTAEHNTWGVEPWVTNGTDTGTVMLQNIGTTWPGTGANIEFTGVSNGLIYFGAEHGWNAGRHVWRTDGTPGGTIKLYDYTGIGYSGWWNPKDFVDVDGTMFFLGDLHTTGLELWKSNGTDTGTVLVKDINVGSLDGDIFHLTAVNGSLFFIADDGTTGKELWKSNGTDTGTVMIKDIYPGSGSSDAEQFTVFNNVLYFVANDSVNGFELWRSDGTAAGTYMLKDIGPGTTDGGITDLVVTGNRLMFSANDIIHGNEAWISDGTPGGTHLLKDIYTGTLFANPSNLTSFNDILYFTVDDGLNGIELWRSDGTAQGTYMVKDIVPGAGSSSIGNLTVFNNALYFSANDGSNGTELWKSDGTANGTALLKDIRSGFLSSFPAHFRVVGNVLFFRANDGNSGTELWKTDGTSSGTVLVKDINTFQSGSSSNPTQMTAIDNLLFFSATDVWEGEEPWVSDGTGIGTNVVPVSPSVLEGDPLYFTGFRGQTYFSAQNVNTSDGRELWVIDSAAATAQLLKDIHPGNLTDSEPRHFFATDSILLFGADNGSDGRELWVTDGTASGTTLFKDINNGSSGSDPQSLTDFNGMAIFSADHDTTGRELWKTDGTPGGTSMVKNINTGAGSSNPSGFEPIKSQVYFTATTDTAGNELWITNGTDTGTYLFADINPGINSSSPGSLIDVGGKLFFTADDGVHGRELWVYIDTCNLLSADVVANGPTDICQGDSLSLSVMVNISGNYTYQWRSDQIDISGATDTVLKVFQAGSYDLYVDKGNECSDTAAAVIVNVWDIPVAGIAALNDTVVCDGETVTLHAANPDNYTIQWQQNGSPVPGTDTLLSATGSGDYRVILSNNGFCMDTSRNLSVAVHDFPDTQVNTVGQTNLCTGQQVTFEAVDQPGYTYVWQHNGNNLANSTADLTTDQAGDFRVIITNMGLCTDSSGIISVSVNPYPAVQITADADTVFCDGESVNLLAQSDIPVTWKWQQDGSDLPKTDSFLLVNTAADYRAIGTHAGICRDTSRVIGITVHPNPEAKVSRSGAVLSGPAGNYTYQWLLEGSPIPGATDKSYTVTENGNYTLELTDENGCQDISSTFIMNVTGVGEMYSGGFIRIFPNPANRTTHIQWQTDFRGEVRIALINVLGERAGYWKDDKDEGLFQKTLDLSAFSKGIYWLAVEQDGHPIAYRRIIIQ